MTMLPKDKRTVSLILGSGGARGLAHIGIIHWLEENNFKIESISGCSIGALIGGIYAAGKLDDFEEWVRAITRVDIFTLLDLSWEKNGLVKGDRIINTLVELVGDQLIEHLPISFTATAADIINEKEVWIESGRLFDAIRASISLPLFFTPFDYKGVQLIDGGVLNPVPIAPAFSDETDMIIAVNLGGAPVYQEPVTDEINESSPFHERILRFVSSFQQSEARVSGHDWGAYDIANQAFDAMQSTIARQKIAAYPPDHVIEIARNACGTLEFERASEVIELGYRKAQESLSPLIKNGDGGIKI